MQAHTRQGNRAEYLKAREQVISVNTLRAISDSYYCKSVSAGCHSPRPFSFPEVTWHKTKLCNIIILSNIFLNYKSHSVQNTTDWCRWPLKYQYICFKNSKNNTVCLNVLWFTKQTPPYSTVHCTGRTPYWLLGLCNCSWNACKYKLSRTATIYYYWDSYCC